MLVIPYALEPCDTGCFDVSTATGTLEERAFNFLGSQILITLLCQSHQGGSGYELASQPVMMEFEDHANPVIPDP